MSIYLASPLMEPYTVLFQSMIYKKNGIKIASPVLISKRNIYIQVDGFTVFMSFYPSGQMSIYLTRQTDGYVVTDYAQF